MEPTPSSSPPQPQPLGVESPEGRKALLEAVLRGDTIYVHPRTYAALDTGPESVLALFSLMVTIEQHSSMPEGYMVTVPKSQHSRFIPLSQLLQPQPDV
jgi:hypothetical protein